MNLNSNGTFTYDPDTDFVGIDTFVYNATDGIENATATVTITVTVTVLEEPNTAPVANDDIVTTLPDTPIIVDVLANDTDADGDALAITNFTAPANGITEFSVLTDLSQTINNPIPTASDRFGVSVSISDDRILVGTPLNNSGAISSGSAYLFNATTG